MIERIKYGPQLELDHTVGGNKDNVVNPRNTFKKEDIIKRTDAGRWNFDYIAKNNLWRNEV
jgi:hypothetical protein